MIYKMNNAEICFCDVCHNGISDRYYLSIGTKKKAHYQCLVCKHCHESLSSNKSCYEKKDGLFCKKCYFQLFSRNKCNKCFQGLSSSDLVMQVRENYYHVNCFRCTICTTVMEKGQRFGIRNNDIYCEAHYRNSNTINCINRTITTNTFMKTNINNNNNNNINNNNNDYYMLPKGNISNSTSTTFSVTLHSGNPANLQLATHKSNLSNYPKSSYEEESSPMKQDLQLQPQLPFQQQKRPLYIQQQFPQQTSNNMQTDTSPLQSPTDLDAQMQLKAKMDALPQQTTQQQQQLEQQHQQQHQNQHQLFQNFQRQVYPENNMPSAESTTLFLSKVPAMQQQQQQQHPKQLHQQHSNQIQNICSPPSQLQQNQQQNKQQHHQNISLQRSISLPSNTGSPTNVLICMETSPNELEIVPQTNFAEEKHFTDLGKPKNLRPNNLTMETNEKEVGHSILENKLLEPIMQKLPSPTDEKKDVKLHKRTTSSSTSSGDDEKQSNEPMNGRKRSRSKNVEKPKRIRTSFKIKQLLAMKELFDVDKNPDSTKLSSLAQEIELPKRVLQVWFQNARAKHRKGLNIFSDTTEKMMLPESSTEEKGNVETTIEGSVSEDTNMECDEDQPIEFKECSAI